MRSGATERVKRASRMAEGAGVLKALERSERAHRASEGPGGTMMCAEEQNRKLVESDRGGRKLGFHFVEGELLPWGPV